MTSQMEHPLFQKTSKCEEVQKGGVCLRHKRTESVAEEALSVVNTFPDVEVQRQAQDRTKVSLGEDSVAAGYRASLCPHCFWRISYLRDEKNSANQNGQLHKRMSE
jgi:hypothetical protein